ncbi:MAG TPA: DUF4142 domain-containing protein [Opitutaceae bacterium]|nr:DUF4142 domain-containing protein [Opitutaceae bacterium]
MFLAPSLAARIRPPIAAFTSVARVAQIDVVPSDNLRPSERTFLLQTGEMTRSELRLARLAVSQAVGSDLRAFAQQLATDFGQINDALAGLVRKKGVAILPPSLATGAPVDAYDQLATKTGTDFDQTFLLTVSAAEEQMMKLLDQALADAKDADVRDFAGSFLPVVRDHVNKLKELRKATS